MEFKGTKGEWHVINGTSIVDKDGFGISETDYPYRIDENWGEKGAKHWCEKGFHIKISEDEAQANAKLIAAAPDLLEALRDLLETCPCDSDITSEFWQANQKAKQAIEKALK